MAASDYNKLIPQPTDQLNISQGGLLLNFGAIADLIDVDHVDFAATGAGKHKKVSFPVQSVAPTFSAGEMGLYNFLSPVTGINELWVVDAAVNPTPMTASIFSTDPTPNNNTPGWTWLPSGLLVKWGFGSATGSTTLTFPVAGNIPVFTQVVWASVCPRATAATDPNTMATLYTMSATGLVVYGSERTTTTPAAAAFQYIAFGY